MNLKDLSEHRGPDVATSLVRDLLVVNASYGHYSKLADLAPSVDSAAEEVHKVLDTLTPFYDGLITDLPKPLVMAAYLCSRNNSSFNILLGHKVGRMPTTTTSGCTYTLGALYLLADQGLLTRDTFKGFYDIGCEKDCPGKYFSRAATHGLETQGLKELAHWLFNRSAVYSGVPSPYKGVMIQVRDFLRDY